MHRPVKLVIFDLDDTLIKSSINYSQIRNQIAQLFIPPLPSDVASKTPILELLEILKRIHPEKYNEGYRRIDEAEREATRTATVIQGAKNIPGIIRKYKLSSVIYTNNSKNTIDLYLANQIFDFLKTFQILTREDFTKPKPDPEGLISIIKGFNDKEITKKNTVYVGDSYIDAIAAYRAKIRFVWFNSRKIDESLFPAPPYANITDWYNFESVIFG